MPSFGALTQHVRAMLSSEKTEDRFDLRDWPTVVLYFAVYLFAGLALFATGFWVLVAWPVLVLALVLHSSLSHEMLHGRPFGKGWFGTLAGLPQPGLFIPFLRFKRLHLAHHRDARLTDPYDDPESAYLDPAVWDGLADWQKRVLLFNNTLGGRMLIGPALGQWAMCRDDFALIRRGDRQVALDWLLHLPFMLAILAVVLAAPLSVWAYVMACYAAMSVLKIRTFLEHRAHDHTAARTVIIEGQCPLSFLFLNNSFHLVHHMYPEVAWYRLPALYVEQRARFLARNQGYVYRSYTQIIRQFMFARKEPVSHPLWKAGDK